jgi:uncharacterized protein (TIGR00251 family)
VKQAQPSGDLADLAIVAQEDGSILPVAAQPGARREGVLGVRAGALRIAVIAPPDKGKANEAIQSLLASTLGCRTTQIALVSGATSRQKRFRIAGIGEDDLRRRLAARILQRGDS